MQEPFPSHLLQYLIPKYVWFDFFSLWGLGVKRLSKYAHESLWRKVAQRVVQLPYRNCNRRCRRTEPELGSWSRGTADPRGFAASVSAKFPNPPRSVLCVASGVFHDAAVEFFGSSQLVYRRDPVSVSREQGWETQDRMLQGKGWSITECHWWWDPQTWPRGTPGFLCTAPTGTNSQGIDVEHWCAPALHDTCAQTSCPSSLAIFKRNK